MTRPAWLWFACALVLIAGACSTRPRTAAQTTDPAALPRLDAFRGSTLVVTTPPQAEAPDATAVLDDGTRLEAAAYRVSARPASADSRPDGWLPAPATWMTIAAREKPKGVGPWVVTVETPAESAARTITVAGKSYALNWLPDVSMLPVPNEEAPEPLLNPWPPVADERARADPQLMERTRTEAWNPLTRWRYKLLMEGLAPSPTAPDPFRFKDPVIEAIARQNEDRWRVALAWLWSADPELAWRLKQRLAAIVDFGAGVHAPAWTLDHASMDLLLLSLLNAGITPKRRSELARAWLMDQPAGVAWVIDDAGVLDDVRRTPIATLGFANLGDIATRAWVESQAREESDFLPLLSMSTLKLLVPLSPCTTPGVPTSTLTCNVGTTTQQVAVLCGRVPVQPPGLSIGPLVRDYTMQAWLRGPAGVSSLQVEEPWATAALLHRPPPDPASPPSSVESRRWELLVECRIPSTMRDVEALKREAVTLFVGPSGKPTAALRIDLAGTVQSVLPTNPDVPVELQPTAGRTDITRAIDRWSFRIPLPPGAVEGDGTVRLGVMRTDARGIRSAWPRPLLPWQPEPARAALDSHAWAGNGAEAP